ncbi:MAG: YkgJ family cysteine cluster protein [Candidatus Thorarchaeota archaeon]|nr:YkgJ family cysteine cluster protein [Candidatus Thorarchaeota archaeon]
MQSHSSEIRFECTKCGACCRSELLLVTITGSDLLRIRDALRIDTPQLLRAIDFYTLDADEVPAGLKHVPAVSTEKGLAYMALRKLENGDCIFLSGNECMIYPVRPSVCRAFPFFFREDNGVLKWGLSAMKHICEGLGQGPAVHAEELATVALQVTSDMKEYRAFVEMWNAREHSPSAKYLIDELLSSARPITQ